MHYSFDSQHVFGGCRPHLSKGAAHSVKLRKTGMAGPAVLPTEPTDLCIQTLVTDLCIQTLVTLT